MIKTDYPEQGRVYVQKWIEREDLRNNPDVFFLFGDNTIRRGMGGQAGAMRGEPNAIGIATKMTPTSESNAFFDDLDLETNCRIIAKDFRKAFQMRDKGHMIVIPADGLGTGLSELPTRAPKTNEFLEWMLDLLKNSGQPAWKSLINGG